MSGSYWFKTLSFFFKILIRCLNRLTWSVKLGVAWSMVVYHHQVCERDCKIMQINMVVYLALNGLFQQFFRYSKDGVHVQWCTEQISLMMKIIIISVICFTFILEMKKTKILIFSFSWFSKSMLNACTWGIHQWGQCKQQNL